MHRCSLLLLGEMDQNLADEKPEAEAKKSARDRQTYHAILHPPTNGKPDSNETYREEARENRWNRDLSCKSHDTQKSRWTPPGCRWEPVPSSVRMAKAA